jgi:hypothetical protein
MALRVSMGSMHPPRNVQQITKAAQDYEYDAQVPLKYWLRSAQAMLQEVACPSHDARTSTDALRRQKSIYEKATKRQPTSFCSDMPI